MINGFPFRAALEPNGKGSHWLRVNKPLHDAAGADAGDTVTVEITRAGEEPERVVPRTWKKMVLWSKNALTSAEKLTFHRRI